MLIDTSSISILDKPGYQADLIAMINATITALNNGTYNPTHTAGTRRLPPINLATPSGSVGNIGGTLNVTKVSTVGLHVMEDIYDILENVPEMGALFTMLNCKDSHYMNTKITSQYGPIVHVAVTGELAWGVQNGYFWIFELLYICVFLDFFYFVNFGISLYIFWFLHSWRFVHLFIFIFVYQILHLFIILFYDFLDFWTFVHLFIFGFLYFGSFFSTFLYTFENIFLYVFAFLRIVELKFCITFAFLYNFDTKFLNLKYFYSW